MNLTDLATKHKCDKGSLHGYMEKYEEYFAPLKDLPIHLLELGIEYGASMRMWEDYFTKAQIFGLDMHKKKETEGVKSKLFYGDQNDRQVVYELGVATAPLDVVIDDCSHSLGSIRLSMEELVPFLAPGALYIVEDMNHAEREVVKERMQKNNLRFLEYFEGKDKQSLVIGKNENTDNS